MLDNIPREVFIYHIFRYLWNLDDLDNISKLSEILCRYVCHYKKTIIMENYDDFNKKIEHYIHTKIKYNYISECPAS